MTQRRIEPGGESEADPGQAALGGEGAGTVN
jgi:hypothetical protein